MKKVVRITESDLEQIVRKVLKEQGNMFGTAGVGIPAPFVQNQGSAKTRKNINPKNLKQGDGGKFRPDQAEDVKILQQKLIDLGLLNLTTDNPSGYFGDLTQKALDLYNKGVIPSKTKIQTTPSAVGRGETKKRVQPQQNTKNLETQKLSSQVIAQLNYMKSKNLLSNQKFTILDDKNSQVHAFTPGYNLFRTYYVITGKNRGDELKTQTMKDWVMKNWTDVGAKFFSSIYNQTKNLVTKGYKSAQNPLQDVANYIDGCYFNQKEWNIKNTPSGVFKRAGNVVNFMNDLLATTFIEKDYGARFVTWQTCDGTTIPFGFHGTKSSERIKNLPGGESFSKKQCTKRKMSFGCINFNDADVKEISSFITAGQLSIWLPDTSNNIVEIPPTCL